MHGKSQVTHNITVHMAKNNVHYGNDTYWTAQYEIKQAISAGPAIQDGCGCRDQAFPQPGPPEFDGATSAACGWWDNILVPWMSDRSTDTKVGVRTLSFKIQRQSSKQTARQAVNFLDIMGSLAWTHFHCKSSVLR